MASHIEKTHVLWFHEANSVITVQRRLLQEEGLKDVHLNLITSLSKLHTLSRNGVLGAVSFSACGIM